MTALAKPLLELKKRKLSLVQQQQHNFSFGAAGEARAITFLKNKNFHILETNVRLGNHEVDIVAVDPVTNELVFIEVKTRNTNFFGDPSLAVNRKKMHSMQVVAREYLRKRGGRQDYRFDVLAVLPDEIEQYENVTW